MTELQGLIYQAMPEVGSVTSMDVAKIVGKTPRSVAGVLGSLYRKGLIYHTGSDGSVKLYSKSKKLLDVPKVQKKPMATAQYIPAQETRAIRVGQANNMFGF